MNSRKSKKTGQSGAKGTPGSPMNVGLLQQIVQLMAENDLNTVDVRDGDQRIILKRGQPQMIAPQVGAYPAPVYAHHAAPPPAAAPSAPSGAAPAAGAGEEAGLVPLKSPMVGTFYAASSPDAKPFVSVGSVVDEETDVCIIEAMKVFNNIKAEMRGTIAKVLVTNGQTVEYGQSLFLVKPN